MYQRTRGRRECYESWRALSHFRRIRFGCIPQGRKFRSAGPHQKPYILRDGVTYGTSLKLVGIQLVAINSDAGVDSGDLTAADVADLFGTTAGFKTSEPNVTPSASAAVDDDDF